jgi:DNA gyrase/topoisomerase IV subunit B
MKKFLRKNKEYLDIIIERAKSRTRLQNLKDASKNAKKASRSKIHKLLDANSRKERHLCQLFICEGDSAKAAIVGSIPTDKQEYFGV